MSGAKVEQAVSFPQSDAGLPADGNRLPRVLDGALEVFQVQVHRTQVVESQSTRFVVQRARNFCRPFRLGERLVAVTQFQMTIREVDARDRLQPFVANALSLNQCRIERLQGVTVSAVVEEYCAVEALLPGVEACAICAVPRHAGKKRAHTKTEGQRLTVVLHTALLGTLPIGMNRGIDLFEEAIETGARCRRVRGDDFRRRGVIERFQPRQQRRIVHLNRQQEDSSKGNYSIQCTPPAGPVFDSYDIRRHRRPVGAGGGARRQIPMSGQ